MEQQLSLTDDSTGIRQQRTRKLDPDLVGSRFSHQWAFALPSSFRSALDILLTTTVERGVASETWTQGQNYDFKVGDTIYDTHLAYGAWDEALPHIKTCLSVKSARKASPSSFTSGEVSFQVFHPHDGKLVASGIYKGTQADFVELLRTGEWQGTSHQSL